VQCMPGTAFGSTFQHFLEFFLRHGHHLAPLHLVCIHVFVLQKCETRLVGGFAGLVNQCQMAMPVLQPGDL
jgi:hypothetical protein